MIGTVILIVLILLLIGLFPAPYNRGWNPYGYFPAGVVGVILIIVLILVLLGRF